MKEILNADLLGRNSFGIDAKVARMVEFCHVDELRTFLSSRKEETTDPLAIIGSGNNILFTGDFSGTLLHPVNDDFVLTDQTAEYAEVRAGAGLDWDRFVELCIELNLWGAENLSAIPGTVGAAPVQNIGAYGAEAKDIILSVETLDLTTLKKSVIAAGHCDFGYRDSIFKRALSGKVIITAVNFRLFKTPRPNLGYGALEQEVTALGGATLKNIRTGVINIRNAKLPDPAVIGNAGSFFKNPVVEIEIVRELKQRHPDMPSYPGSCEENLKVPAGWLIEQSGWKGATMGNAGVYPKQALILVNLGGASGSEIMALAQAIITDVKSKFGITIETEVNIW